MPNTSHCVMWDLCTSEGKRCMQGKLKLGLDFAADFPPCTTTVVDSVRYLRPASQREIFETCVRPLLSHALNGENVSIFAYGPTGAGKLVSFSDTLLGSNLK